MAAAERHKGQPRQVEPQHDQALQQLLGPPAGHKGCQQVQRVTQAVIAQRGNDIRTVTDGKSQVGTAAPVSTQRAACRSQRP